MITIFYSRARERELLKLEQPRVGSWVHVVAPTEEELEQLVSQYGLDRDTLNDAIDIYEAPRIEVEDGAVYIFTRYCYPEGREIASEPLLIIHTADHLFTISRIDSNVLHRLTENELEFVTTQKTKTLLHILSEINNSYKQPLRSAAKRILQLRGQMRQSKLSTKEFLGIIELEEDLNEFLSALQPQGLLYGELIQGRYLRLYEDDRDIVEDLEHSTAELVEQLRGRLRTLGNMREAFDAIATNSLNSIFKRLTSISIFMSIPTIMAGFWGVNVLVPFQHSTFAFLYLAGITLAIIAVVVWYFRRKNWL